MDAVRLTNVLRKFETTPAELTPLWKYLQHEDRPNVEKLVKGGQCNVNIQDSTFGWTPSHFVCNTGDTGLIKFLLDARARLGVGDNEGNTPLMLACRRGHLVAVEFLISNAVQLDVQNKNGWTALIWAAISGHEDVAMALMSANSDYSATDNMGRSAIMWAARHGHLGIVEAILACGINLGIEDHAGMTVMDHAREQSSMRSVIAAVGELNDELLPAVKRGDKEEVASLLQAGANVELRDEDGWTPLMWAVLQKSVDLVELIIRHGANPSLLDAKGEAIDQLGLAHVAVGEALHTILGANDRMLAAAKDNDWDIVEEELKLGAFVNTRDETKRTCLMWAGRNHASDAIASLVSKNALLNERDLFGWSAAHYAVESHDLESVAMLWHLGADFTLRTSEEDSLLHIAVRGDDAPMVQLLLASHAKLEDLNVEAHTPLMVATANSLTNSVHTLLAYKASVNACDGCRRTPFAVAVVRGQMKAISAMLDPRMPPKVAVADGKGSKPRPRKGLRAALPKKPSTAPAGGLAQTRMAHRKSLAFAASGVARRRKVAPAAAAERRGDDPKALIDLAAHTRSEVVNRKLSVNLGALLRQVDCDGRTPLALAVTTSNMQIFHLLIEEKADPSATSASGNTVLIDAVVSKQADAVARLLELGVRADKRNKEGKTAHDLCEDADIKQMLDRYAIASKLPEQLKEVPVLLEKIHVEQKKPVKAARGYRVRMEQLPTQLTDELLEEAIRLFLKQRGAASIARVEVALDPITSRPRGYAYVDLADAVCADLALRGDGLKMNGQVVRVVRETVPSVTSG